MLYLAFAVSACYSVEHLAFPLLLLLFIFLLLFLFLLLLLYLLLLLLIPLPLPNPPSSRKNASKGYDSFHQLPLLLNLLNQLVFVFKHTKLGPLIR